jgi:hypothetical protein
MPIYRVEIPGKGNFKVESPEELSDAQAYQAVLNQLKTEKPPEKGFLPALFGGAQRAASTIGTTGQAIFGSPEEAAQAGLARQEEISRKFAPGADLEAVKRAYAERGLLPAAAEVASQIPTALAEQFPNIAAALASGRAGAMAGARFGPRGALIGGIGGALAPSVAQLTGSALERQAAEEVPEISLGKAVAAAVPGAALETAATFIPLGRSLVGKILGPNAEKALATGASKADARLVEAGLTRTLATGAAVGAGLEVPTEVIQQMLERLQAGLPLTSEDALAEYGEAAYGAGLVGGPFGAVGRLGQRAVARSEKRAEEEAERARLTEEERKKAEATEQAEIARRAGAPLFTAEEATMGAEFSTYDAEGKLKEKQQLQTEVQTEYNKLYEQEVQLQDSIKRAKDEGRTGDISTLNAKRKQINELRSKLEERVKDKKDPLYGLKLTTPELVETEDLESLVQADINTVKKRLDKAVDLGDFDKVDQLTAELDELKQKARGLRVQPDLFGTQYQTRLELEAKERKAAEEEMQQKQREAVDVVTLTNLLNLAEQKREARAQRRKTEEERAIEIEQDRALKRLEFNIDRRGLTAIGVVPKDMAETEADINKGVIKPDVAEKLGVFEEDIALAKRKVAETEDKAKKAEYKAELAALQAKIAQPQRSIDVLDNIDLAWEKATAKQRELALDLAANKLELFDPQGKLTKEGAEAVKNQVIVEQLTKLRNAGREARGVVEQQRTEEQQTAEAEAILSGAKPFGQAAAQATKVLPQQRLQRMRDRFEGQIESINDQIRYLQTVPTVEKPGEPEFEANIQDLEIERREFEAALARVKRELGDEVEAAKPTDMNRSLSDFSDAIYPLQRGEFFGKRPAEVDKKGEPTKSAVAEAERNKELQDKIDRLQIALDGVKRRLLDPGLRNIDTRNALAREQSKLEGKIKTLSAGLSKKNIPKQQLVAQAIQKIEKERGEKLSPTEKRAVIEKLEKELLPQSVGNKTFQQLVSDAEKARDEYVNAAIDQVNGVRAARNMPMLQPDVEKTLRESLVSSFNEFIQRASYARRVRTEPLPKDVTRKVKTALGAALAEAGVKGTIKPPQPKLPAEVTPFAKIREALDVLREDLDDKLSRARGDVAPPEPKFELKDYLEVILARKAATPARRIKGESQIEKIADSIGRIDEKLSKLQGIGAGPDYISSLEQRIKLAEDKPEQLRKLLNQVKQASPEELELLADDPVVGPYIQNPEVLQRLYDEARRELPMLKDLVEQEKAKLKTKTALEKLKQAKQEERDAITSAAQKAQGMSQEAIKSSEIQRIQRVVSEGQKEVKELAIMLFDLGRAIKIELPAKARRLKEEIAELTKLAKTDRNPRLRQQKIERLKEQLKQTAEDIVIAQQQSANAKARKKNIQESTKALVDSLQNMGVETTITNEGEFILTQIEDAQDVKEKVQQNALLNELPKFKKKRAALEESIAAWTKENNVISRGIKLLLGNEKQQAKKRQEVNKKKIEGAKVELVAVDRRIARIINVGEARRKIAEAKYTPGQIDLAKKALLKRIEQTQARQDKLPKVDTKSVKDVLERAKIGAIENLGVVNALGQRMVGRKVVFEDAVREQKISEEEIQQQRRERQALFDTQIEAVRKEFEERKAELATVKASPAVKAAEEAAEKAKAAIKSQKNEKDGIRLAKLAENAKDNYEKILTESLSFPIFEMRRYPARIAGLTRLKNFVSTVRYVPVRVATKTELFIDNNKIEREAEKQRFELSVRKEVDKTPIQKADALLAEAKAYVAEAEKALRKAEASNNRALITAAKAEYLNYRKAYTSVLMKREAMEVAITKLGTPKTSSDAAVSAALDIDGSLSPEEKARLKEAVDSYNINRETSWAFGDEVTDVIDMDAAVKRMDEVVAKAAKRGIKVESLKLLTPCR